MGAAEVLGGSIRYRLKWNPPAHVLERGRTARFAHPPLTPPFQGGGTSVRFPPRTDIRPDKKTLSYSTLFVIHLLKPALSGGKCV